MSNRILGWVLLLLAIRAQAEELREGDLLFHTSDSRQSKAIRLVTRSPLTHVGIIFRERGQWMVLEASGRVQATPYRQFLARGQGGHYLHKRWRQGLSGQQVAGMRRLGQSYLGRPYDPLFGWDDATIYCSELVWKLYQRGAGLRLGEPQAFGQLDLSSPAAQVLVRERGKPAASEPVVTPAALAACPRLVTVRTTYR